MTNEPKLIVLVGLPGSGKSTWAKDNTDENTIHISSDEIREALFLGVHSREVNNKVFSLMQAETNSALKAGYNVIYDATNMSYKDRRSILNSAPKNVYKMSILFSVPFEVCLERNGERDNPVPKTVMSNMLKRFNVPLTTEGFNRCDINFSQANDVSMYYDLLCSNGHHKLGYEYLLKKFGEQLIKVIKGDFHELPHSRDSSNEERMQWIFGGLSNFMPESNQIYNLPHDNPNHTYSVSRHSYEVWNYIARSKEINIFETNGSTNIDWESLAVAALFHDMGKGFTKEFKDSKGNPTEIAHYYGHENVSTYFALVAIVRLNSVFGDIVIDPIAVAKLVQFHMKLYPYASNDKRWRKLAGQEMIEMLEILNKADRSAK